MKWDSTQSTEPSPTETAATRPALHLSRQPETPVSEMADRKIKSAPEDGTKIDLHLVIHASPLSMGWTDNFWVPHCWWLDGHWVHMHKGKPERLDPRYIVGWAPDGTAKSDYIPTP